MKKVVRMLGLCALVALAFTSCKKNETTGNVTFKAIISQPTDNTRTHIESINAFGFKGLFWDANNTINVFNIASAENQTYQIDAIKSGDGQIATFQGPADFLAELIHENTYIAFYPMPDNGSMEMTIPAEQDFVWESIADDLYPMYGFNDFDSDDEPVFNFHSHAGMLRLQFKLNSINYGEDAQIPMESIVVTGGDVLAGTMVYALDGTYTMTNPSNTITLNCEGMNMVSTRWTDFYIVFPEGALNEAFTVTLYSANGTSISINGEAGHPITAETITHMPQYEILADF